MENADDPWPRYTTWRIEPLAGYAARAFKKGRGRSLGAEQAISGPEYVTTPQPASHGLKEEAETYGPKTTLMQEARAVDIPAIPAFEIPYEFGSSKTRARKRRHQAARMRARGSIDTAAMPVQHQVLTAAAESASPVSARPVSPQSARIPGNVRADAARLTRYCANRGLTLRCTSIPRADGRFCAVTQVNGVVFPAGPDDATQSGSERLANAIAYRRLTGPMYMSELGDM